MNSDEYIIKQKQYKCNCQEIIAPSEKLPQNDCTQEIDSVELRSVNVSVIFWKEIRNKFKGACNPTAASLGGSS